MTFLNYAQVGTEGHCLLFLHGLNESLDGYRPVMKELEGGLRMHAVDLRGHGNSPWRQPYNLAAYAADIVEYIRTEIGGFTILSGHSLGGLVSAGVAANHPGLVEAVILEDPPFYTAQLPVLKRSPLYDLFTSVRGLLTEHQQKEGEMDELLKLVDQWRVAGSDSPLLRDAYGDNYVKQLALDLHRTDPSTLDPVLNGSLFDGFEPDSLLSQIRCPVMLIAGNSNRGSALREEDADRVASLVDDLEITKLDKVGHEIHTTQPLWFANTIRKFLVAKEMLA